MFFLWKNKPASVLSSSGEWIPKQEIRNRLNEIRIFASAGEARHVQRSKYNKKGVSVLIDKTFKEKAKLQKLPVCKEAATQNPDDCFDGKMLLMVSTWMSSVMASPGRTAGSFSRLPTRS